MKTKTFLSVCRLATLALACVLSIGFTACGGDDDGPTEQPKEPSVDELLSEETTPITFRLESKGTHFLFDYAGSHLVGADTIEVEYAFQKSHKIDLRQGKHRLLWMRGLSGSSQGKTGDIANGIDYDVETDRIILQEDASFYPIPQYYIKEIEVTPYLMPEQKVDYKPLCAGYYILLESPETYMVVMKNIPEVTYVGLEDNRYDIEYSETTLGFLGYGEGKWIATHGRDLLCPIGGLDDIQLEYEVIKFEGTKQVSIHKQQLPKFSIRRGYTTEIHGPLTGGRMEDFVVTTKEYGERY